MTEPLWVLGQAFAVLYGLVVASFWNVAIARLPHGQSLWPRSSCPACGTGIAAYDNVPVASWLALRGRCRSCHTPISVAYPLTEALGGLLGLLLFRVLIPDPAQLDAAHVAAWVVYFVFFSLLVIGSYVDLRYKVLPNEVTSLAVPAGIAGVGLLQWLGFEGFPSTTVQQAVVGCAFWGLLFAGVAGLGQLWKGRPVLGWGDVKLAAMIASFLGPLHTFVAIMWGSIIGSVVGIGVLLLLRRRDSAYGPPLAAGTVAYVLFGQPFVSTMMPMWEL